MSDDYACLETPIARFYYGYEIVKPDGEWCFELRLGKLIPIVVPFSELGCRDQFDVVECLLAGIGHCMRNATLKDLQNAFFK